MEPALAEKIRKKQLQWTPQRETVFSVIANSNNKHLTAEEIFLKTKKIMPTIGLATVYRTLELFCEEGILQKFNLPGEAARYEMLVEDNDVHYHYICLGCGKIFEVPIQKETISSQIENDNIRDFIITKISCWYFGYCKDCMKRQG
jgi:Fur family ferric uptake transcriptional regulator